MNLRDKSKSFYLPEQINDLSLQRFDVGFDLLFMRDGFGVAQLGIRFELTTPVTTGVSVLVPFAKLSQYYLELTAASWEVFFNNRNSGRTASPKG